MHENISGRGDRCVVDIAVPREFEKALKAFEKKFAMNVRPSLRRHEFYMKPSARRKLKSSTARKKRAKFAKLKAQNEDTK